MSNYQPTTPLPKVAYGRKDSYSAEDGVAISVSGGDATFKSTPARALYVGVTGNVAVLTLLGGTVTFSNVPAGMILPIACAAVLQSGTTADSIIALF